MKLICSLCIVIVKMFVGTECASNISETTSDAEKYLEELEKVMTKNPEMHHHPLSTSPFLELAFLNELLKEEINCTHPCTKFMTIEQEEELRSILFEQIGHSVKNKTVPTKVLVMCALRSKYQKDKNDTSDRSKVNILRDVIEEGINKKLKTERMNENFKEGVIEALTRDIKKVKAPQGTALATGLGDLGVYLLGELKVIIQNQTVVANNSSPLDNIYVSQIGSMQSGSPNGLVNISTDQTVATGKTKPKMTCEPFDTRAECKSSCASGDVECFLKQSQEQLSKQLSANVVKQINDVYEIFTGTLLKDDDNDDDDDDDDDDLFLFRSLLSQNQASYRVVNVDSIESRSGIKAASQADKINTSKPLSEQHDSMQLHSKLPATTRKPLTSQKSTSQPPSLTVHHNAEQTNQNITSQVSNHVPSTPAGQNANRTTSKITSHTTERVLPLTTVHNAEKTNQQGTKGKPTTESIKPNDTVPFPNFSNDDYSRICETL